MIEKVRNLYEFICSKCGKKRSTLKEGKAVDGICRKCKAVKIPENQMSLV